MDRNMESIRGSRMFQYLATASSCCNSITSGMHYGWTSPSLSKLLHKDSSIPTTNSEGSWIAVTILAGAVCGSITSSLIIDKLGRKNVILLSGLMFFISWIMVAYAKSVSMLIAARFVAGIPDGLVYCAIPMYVAEISDPEIRGFLSSAFVTTSISGILLMNLIGSFLSLTASALVASALPIALLLTFWWMPESPYSLVMRGKIENARCSLILLKGTDDVDEDLTRIRKAVEEQHSNTGKYLDLFTVNANRKTLFIMLGVRAFTEFTGTTAIVFYAQIIFKDATDVLSPVFASTIFFGCKMLASLLSSLVVDRTGRKPLLIISLIGSSIFLLTLGCYLFIKNVTDLDISRFSIISVIALIGLVIMVNIGVQTIAIVLIGEIFATNVKAFAFSVNDVCYCLFSIIASKFFQFTKDEFGSHVPFFTFAACCAVGVPFAVLCVPETKQKTLEQIQDELTGKISNREATEMQLMLEKR